MFIESSPVYFRKEFHYMIYIYTLKEQPQHLPLINVKLKANERKIKIIFRLL